MGEKYRKISVMFTDAHVPYHSPESLEVVKKVVQALKPNYVSSLGDMLDCSQFSTHDPTYGVDNTELSEDIRFLQRFYDDIQKDIKEKLIMVEGNHEQRVTRWAAKTKEGRAVYNMVAPHIQLMKTSKGDPRAKAIYVKYGSADGKYPHYKLNSRICLIHGWSYASHVTAQHVKMSMGRSIILGHCHRMESKIVQNVWGAGSVQCHAIGCLCQKVPLYGCGAPVEWVNGLCVGYHGRHSDTVYPIHMVNGACVLPDGREIKV